MIFKIKFGDIKFNKGTLANCLTTDDQLINCWLVQPDLISPLR